MKAIAALLLTIVATATAKPDPKKIIAGLNFVVPATVHWQGSLPKLPAKEQQRWIDGLAAMMAYTAKFAPDDGDHVFDWQGGPGYLQKKGIHIYFTDADEITIEPPMSLRTASVPLPHELAVQNILLRGGQSGDIYYYCLIVRMDRCLYTGKRRSPRPEAFLNISTALAGQLYGYAPILFLGMSYLDIVNIDAAANAVKTIRGRRKSLEAEAAYLDAVIASEGFKLFPEAQREFAREKRRRVFGQDSSIFIADPDCDDELRGDLN